MSFVGIFYKKKWCFPATLHPTKKGDAFGFGKNPVSRCFPPFQNTRCRRFFGHILFGLEIFLCQETPPVGFPGEQRMMSFVPPFFTGPETRKPWKHRNTNSETLRWYVSGPYIKGAINGWSWDVIFKQPQNKVQTKSVGGCWMNGQWGVPKNTIL